MPARRFRDTVYHALNSESYSPETPMRKPAINLLLLWLLQALTSARIGGAQQHGSAAVDKNPRVVARVKAVPLPLSSVRLTGGPLKRAQDLDAQYLLELQPDRMLAYL